MARSARLWLAMVAAALACSCGKKSSESTGDADAQSGLSHRTVVRVDGSSTVFPITEAVAEEFQKATPGARVIVGISGTGGGFKKFCNGETDITDASRPIRASEIEQCAKRGVEYVELPVAYDGLAVLVSPKNTWANHITTEELKRAWEPQAQGRVTRWSDLRVGWPNEPLRLYGPGVASGSYDFFSEAIVGRPHATRGDFTSSEDDNVLAQGIASDEAALGYVGFAYYERNKQALKLLTVDDKNPHNGRGAIAPSFETLRGGRYQPLLRPIFIYVSAQALERRDVVRFANYYLEVAAELSRDVGYVPLSERAYALARQRMERRVTGTSFGGGSTRGVSIEALLEREGT